MKETTSEVITSPVIEFEVMPPDVSSASTELSCPSDKVMELYKPFEKPFEAAAALLAEEESAVTSTDARILRLKMVKARTTITATKDESKSDIKLAGNIIDWFHNKGRDRLAASEARLLEIEKAEERAEAARLEALRRDRENTIVDLGGQIHGINLGTFTDEQWKAYHQQAEDAAELRAIREVREREAAAAKELKEIEEREAQRLENIRLREEAEHASRLLAAEREEQAKRDAAAAAAAAAEREARAQEAKAAEKKAEAERQKVNTARLKAEAEAKALRDAEAKRIADEEAKAKAVAAEVAAKAKAEALAAKKAAAAPDKTKLLEFAIAVRNMPVPPVKSDVANEVRDDIAAKLESFAKWIEATVSVL